MGCNPLVTTRALLIDTYECATAKVYGNNDLLLNRV
jgi:hypothetical protein